MIITSSMRIIVFIFIHFFIVQESVKKDSDVLSLGATLVVDFSELQQPDSLLEINNDFFLITEIRSGWIMTLYQDTTTAPIALQTADVYGNKNVQSLSDFKVFANGNIPWRGSCKGCIWGEYKLVYAVIKDEGILKVIKLAPVIVDY